MRIKCSLLTFCLLVAGCAGSSLATRQDANVISSLQFDAVPCKQLLAQRNELSQRYGLPRDAKPVFSNPPIGLGPFTPDIRSENQRGTEKASGQIDAMNRSLIRRQCVPKPKGG